MNIIIFGPQGSGKGTQANLLSAHFNIPHISTGDIFRSRAKEKSDFGKQIAGLINSGQLVPDGITNRVVAERLVQKDAADGFILDGFPRKLIQAQFLDTVTPLDFALEIWIDDDTALSRIGNRRSCPQCGAIYHLLSQPPREENKCDKCGSRLIVRQDDRPEAIKKRLKIYHAQTEPLVDYYKDKGIYRRIDGQPAIEEVNEEVLIILKE